MLSLSVAHMARELLMESATCCLSKRYFDCKAGTLCSHIPSSITANDKPTVHQPIAQNGSSVSSTTVKSRDDLDYEFRVYQRHLSDIDCRVGRSPVRNSGIISALMRRCRSRSNSRLRRIVLTGEDDEEFTEEIELYQLSDVAIARLPNNIDAGHMFLPVYVDAPMWCDKCGQLIVTVYRHCLLCKYCQYTCHSHCRHLITVQCPESLIGCRGRHPTRVRTETSLIEYSAVWMKDSGYLSSSSANSSVPFKANNIQQIFTENELKTFIGVFNTNNHGLLIKLDDDGKFSGFVRVHMNLYRPITVCVSVNPPSVDVTQAEPTEQYTAHTTSFYLPRGTSKVIHINSKTTSREVIAALLSKFNITDNPLKFAMYEKTFDDARKQVHHTRRLRHADTPLALCLNWTVHGGLEALDKHEFVLQENDPGEIAWEIFSVPELENFLSILNLEEMEYIEQIRHKYMDIKRLMLKRCDQLRAKTLT